MQKKNQKFWSVCGWFAAILAQLVYWSCFIFRHNTIIMSPGGRLHPDYTYAQVKVMMLQKPESFDTFFVFCVDLMVPFLFLVLLFTIYETHLSPENSYHAPLPLRLSIIGIGLALAQFFVYKNYRSEYYLLYMPASKTFVASLIWFAMCFSEKFYSKTKN